MKRLIKWVFGALYNTMDNRGARFVVANNIIGSDTVVTNIMKRPGARVNIVNAIQENGEVSWNKYSLSFFEERRKIIGDYAFQTEFMNNPQVEGEIFKDEQIQWAVMPRIDRFECIVGHWDIAYAGTTSGDYNAIKIWGLKEQKFYCIKAFVRQCKMSAAIKWMIDFEKQLPKGIKIHWRFESQFWNDAVKSTIREVCDEMKYPLHLTQCERPVKNKFDRIVSMQPYYQNGRVYYNVKEEFNVDMQTGMNQLKGIEPGYKSHDDSPDADEGAISYLNKFIIGNNPLPILGDRRRAKGAW